MSIKKKLTAFVAACALLMALPVMAFAEPATQPTTQPTFQPVIVSNDKIVAKVKSPKAGEKVTLDVVATEPTKLGTFTPKLETVATDNTKIVLAVADSQLLSTSTAEALFANYKFLAPGDYNFTVKQLAQDPESPNVLKYDATEYKVTVRVVVNAEGNGLVVEGIYVESDNGKAGGDGSETKPIPVMTWTNTSNQGDVFVLAKEITGNLKNVNDVFTFTVAVSNALNEYTVEAGTGVEVTGVSDNKFTVAQGKATTLTVQMKAGDAFKITDLPAGAKVEVKETDKQGYTLTDVVFKDTTDGTVITEAGKSQTAINNGGSLVVNTDSKADTITLTNKKTDKDAPTPTGILMEFAPFIMIALAAIAGLIVFFVARRRRAADEF